ncbi:hypothetical protein CAL15_22625 [Bordetella genomosp. 13]|uniref:Uncharacterized protein n=1 Tax=Bordetella genomosp. 13 TaxID=463040 RepID=A0A1W6ZJD0_9BORD|nr:hypothetical protein [Bordetella genomosp. 13]ARP96914.1 hypothetical protein CAL15_22625 [Bordetella genomosp. 13]
MVVQTWARRGVMLVFATLVSGCSTLGGSDEPEAAPPSSSVDIQCRLSRSSCIHEGSYEPGERDYAEEEAARRNRAELDRLRRSR